MVFRPLQVINALGMSEADCSPPVLPALKRRNSGKRNLHKPWTSTEEEQLVKLVDQADYRKEVRQHHSRCSPHHWDKQKFVQLALCMSAEGDSFI